MDQSPDKKYHGYYDPHRPSSIPDRPIDFLDELIELKKLSADPDSNEQVVYLLPGTNQSDQLVTVKAPMSELLECNPFVQRLLAVSRAETKDPAAGPVSRPPVYIAKQTVMRDLDNLGADQKMIDSLAQHMAQGPQRQFISLSEIIDFCQRAANAAVDHNDPAACQIYNQLCIGLCKRYHHKQMSNIFRLTHEDIAQMKAQGIDPDQSRLHQIKTFFNQKNYE